MNVVSAKELAEFFNERREHAQNAYNFAEGSVESLISYALKDQADADCEYWKERAGE